MMLTTLTGTTANSLKGVHTRTQTNQHRDTHTHKAAAWDRQNPPTPPSPAPGFQDGEALLQNQANGKKWAESEGHLLPDLPCPVGGAYSPLTPHTHVSAGRAAL